MGFCGTDRMLREISCLYKGKFSAQLAWQLWRLKVEAFEFLNISSLCFSILPTSVNFFGGVEHNRLLADFAG